MSWHPRLGARHSREGGSPGTFGSAPPADFWIPAFAGMTGFYPMLLVSMGLLLAAFPVAAQESAPAETATDAVMDVPAGAEGEEGGTQVEGDGDASVSAGAQGLRASVRAGQSQQQIASLHRVAATLESVLDVYRLALVELVPAVRRITEAGEAPDATPTTLIPEPSREVFWRLARGVASRVPVESLPAISRGYHAEVLDALEQLALAEEIGKARPHVTALSEALTRLLERADDVVDLFSRERPVVARSVNPDTILDEISGALDELAAAERSVVDLRKKDATLGDQLQAFLRLEVSLGHALDLIALAEESGIQLGFKLRLSTEMFAALLVRVRSGIEGLNAQIALMAREPAALSGKLEAVRLEEAEGGARLVWGTPTLTGPDRAAVIRIYRAPDAKGLNILADAQRRCSGEEDPDVAAPEAGRAKITDLPAGRTRYTDPTASPWASTAYEVVPVSVFGVEGPGVSSVALHVPKKLEGPRWVEAKLANVSADSNKYYYDYDAVTVTWGASPSDVRQDASALALATETGRPVVSKYKIVRVTEEAATPIGTVFGGTTSYVDHPPVEVLEKGLRYSVIALDAAGNFVPPPERCAGSDDVKGDFAQLELASLGLADVVHPTSVELDRRKELQSPDALRSAVEEFSQRSEAAQAAAMEKWWSQVPEERRRDWLSAWPDHMNDDEKGRFFGSPPTELSSRDQSWAEAEIWLMAQPPEVQAEVSRWWELMDEKGRRAALDAWYATQDDAVLAWIKERAEAGGEGMRYQLERPARVLAWWNSRDAMERAKLRAWWSALSEELKGNAVIDWYGTLSEPVQRSVHWPDWDERSDAEREHALENAYVALPSGLWPRFLGWLAWEDLRDDNVGFGDAIKAEVGAVGSLMTQMRFMFRPVDNALSFRFPVLLFLLLISGLMGFFLYQSIVRKKEMYLRRIPGIDAIEEAIGRATEMGRPVLFVPGIGEVQEIQTIAGLLILGKVSETIARYDSDIVVANIYPFVQTVAREVVQRGCYDAARPDLYDPDDVRYVAAEQFPFTAGVNGIMLREKPAANLFLGQFFAESLILAETGFLTGAVQIAGTAEVFQLPFFLAACDYTLIGEELFATSAYLSKEPKLTSTLKAGDWVKAAMVAAITLGVILESLGVTALTQFFVSN